MWIIFTQNRTQGRILKSLLNKLHKALFDQLTTYLSGLSSFQSCFEHKIVPTTQFPALLNFLILGQPSISSQVLPLPGSPWHLISLPSWPHLLPLCLYLLTSHCMVITEVCLPHWFLSLKQFLAYDKQSACVCLMNSRLKIWYFSP